MGLLLSWDPTGFHESIVGTHGLLRARACCRGEFDVRLGLGSFRQGRRVLLYTIF